MMKRAVWVVWSCGLIVALSGCPPENGNDTGTDTEIEDTSRLDTDSTDTSRDTSSPEDTEIDDAGDSLGGEDSGDMDTSPDSDSPDTGSDGGGDTCVPDCTGKQCGSDGCGGTCGTCSGGQNCVNNQCQWPSTSFSGDVMPLIRNNGCQSAACHDANQPQAGLDLSSTSTAYNNLVGVRSSQCGGGRLLVEAGAPGGSYLIDKLAGTNLCSGSQMPKGGSPLASSEIDTIRAWIGNGAPNN